MAEAEGNFKVVVVGGAGGIGQPLALLMAMDPNVAELVICDLNVSMVPAAGVAADLSHLEGKCRVSHLTATVNVDKWIEVGAEAFTGADLVLVPAGVPRKPGQDRKDLLAINAGIAKGVVEAVAAYAPEAVVALIVNPVNSVVPAMCELWKQVGLDPRKIVGISTLDVVRANKFVREVTGMAGEVPVVGGHAGKTILPLFSQDAAGRAVDPGLIPELDARVQDAGTEVVKAKNGKGSATLSMAYAGARLGRAVLRGLLGYETVECAYVESNVQPGMPYFASKVSFGPGGVIATHEIGPVSAHESQRLQELFPILQEEIEAGLEYAATTEFLVLAEPPQPQAVLPQVAYVQQQPTATTVQPVTYLNPAAPSNYVMRQAVPQAVPQAVYVQGYAAPAPIQTIQSAVQFQTSAAPAAQPYVFQQPEQTRFTVSQEVFAQLMRGEAVPQETIKGGSSVAYSVGGSVSIAAPAAPPAALALAPTAAAPVDPSLMGQIQANGGAAPLPAAPLRESGKDKTKTAIKVSKKRQKGCC